MAVVRGRRESERTLHESRDRLTVQAARVTFDSNLDSSLSYTYADSPREHSVGLVHG